MVYDDYAHHPTEIKATLKAVKTVAENKMIAVFQPHRYTRLHELWDSFLTSFDDADTVIVCDVYPAGETPIANVSGSCFANALSALDKKVFYVSDLNHLPNVIKEQVSPKDTVVYLGAGSISSASKDLVQKLKGKKIC